MKKKILMLLLLTITILITLGGLNQTDAARICANCKAGDHINCPNRGYTHNSTSHSIWCCCGKTFANAVMHYNSHYLNDSTYCYICVCGYKEKHNTSGGHCSKAHCPYNSSRTLCNRGCNHAKWVSCRDHSYSSTWTRTATHHWKKCTVSSSCTATKSYGAHVDNNGDGKCDVCEISEGTSSSTNDGGGGNAEATDPKPGAPVVNVKGTNFTGTSENNVVYSNSNVSWNIETEDSVSKKPLKLTEYDLSGATTGGNAVTRAGRYNRNGSNAGINSQWVSSVPKTYTFETWIYLPVYGGKSYYIFHTGKGRYSQLYISSDGNLVLYNSSKVYRSYVSQAELQRLGFYSGWAYLSVQAINGKDMNRSNVVIYINGQQAELSIKGKTSSAADMAKSRLQLGGYYSNNNVGLPDGSMMKETKIFNTGVAASSADRMYTEMNSNSAYWGNLIGYWKQVETSGSTMVATAGVSGMYANNANADSARDVSSNYTSAALTNNKFTGTISAEGTTRITANHVGMLGATSETTVDVVIDKTAPTGSMYASTANTNQNSIKIYVAAEDELSGVGEVIVTAWAGSSNWVSTNSEKYATFNADTGLWGVTYNFSEIKNTTTGATNQGQGPYYFGAHIFDKAGNRAIIGTPSVVYDTEGPTGSITLEDKGTYYRAWFTGDDNLTGISDVNFFGWFGVNPSTTSKNVSGTYDSSTGKWYADFTYTDVPHGTSGATNNGGGIYYADCWAVDRAGNNKQISAGSLSKTFVELAGTVTTDKLVTNSPTIRIYIESTIPYDQMSYINVNGWQGGWWKEYALTQTAQYDSSIGKWYADYTFANLPNTTTNETNNGDSSAYLFDAHLVAKDGQYKIAPGIWVTYDSTSPNAGSYTVSGATKGSDGRYYTTDTAASITLNYTGMSDNLSGLSRFDPYLKKDGATRTKDYNVSHNISDTNGEVKYNLNGEGVYVTEIYLYDNANNLVTCESVTIVADKTPPQITSITYDPGWKNVDITKEIEATDTLSGVKLIEYSYDLTTWYSDWESSGNGYAKRTWTEEGDRVVYFRATDYAGNTWIYAYDGTNPSPYDLKIDKTLPNGTVSASTTCTNQNSVTIYVNATDALSGVDHVKMMAWTGSKDWVKTNTEKSTTFNSTTGLWEVSFTFDEIRDTTTGALSQGDGNYYFGAHIYDKAGNRRIVDGTAVIYDTTPPQITSITYDPGWKNVDITKYVEATDNLSGVKLLEYSYDLNTWYSDWDSSAGGNANKTWTEEGDRVVYFRATDNAGNTWIYAYDGTNPSAYDLKIDKTKPVTGTYTVSGTTFKGGKHYVTSETAEITLNFTGMSDNLSGLKLFDVYMKKDGADRTKDYNVSYSINGSTGEVKYKLNGYGTYVTEIYLYDNAGNLKTCLPALTINAVESLPIAKLMERESFEYVSGKDVFYAIGAKRSNNKKYTADLINSITFVDNVNVPNEAEARWDASYTNGDNKVIAWVIPNTTDSTKYDLYIGADDITIVASANSYNLFGEYKNCTAINNLTMLDTSSVTDMDYMFSDCSSLTSLDVSNFNTSNVTNMGSMFSYCSSLTSLNVSNFDTSNVTNMDSMFYNCRSLPSLDVSNFNTSNVTNMGSMFHNCRSLASLEVSNFDTSKVTSMCDMFYGCRSLSSLDVSNFNTSKVTNMRYMFTGCSKLPSLDVSKFDTSQVTDMGFMFDGCNSLVSLDVSNFDTSKVTDMGFMFDGCSSLASLDVSNFDTSQVKSMGFMFSRCSGLTSLDLRNFNTISLDGKTYGNSSGSSVLGVDVNYMFNDCSNLESIIFGNSFNRLDGYDMFKGCSNLKAIITTKAITSPGDAPTLSGTENVTNSSGKIIAGPNGLIDLPNAILYVPNTTSETAYEAATNYSTVFGADRIRPILELVGDNPVKVSKGATYVDSGVTVAGMTKNADGLAYTPYGYTVSGPVIKKDGTVVSSVDTSNVGTYTLTYTVHEPNSSLDGMSVIREVEIESKDISENNPDITVSIPTEDRVYKDAAYTPVVTIKDGTTTLVEGTDYSVSYSDNINAGMATVTIKGINNYTGTRTENFMITQRAVTIKPKDESKVYDTLPLTSNVAEVTAGSLVTGHTATITTTGSITSVGSITNTISTLTIKNASGTDVTANYNVTKATGTLTITSAGSVTFDIALDNNTFEYDGTTKTPTATVKVGSIILEAGTDYDVSYQNNKDAGTATITITGKGNYDGSIGTKEFTITKRKLTIKAWSVDKVYDGMPLTSSKFEITSGSVPSGQTLTVTTSGSITNVGTTSNKIATYKIIASNEDVTKNYDVTTVDGTLKVTPATITGSVKITGQTIYGETLTAEVTTVPADCTLTYNWYYSTSATATSGTSIGTGSTLALNNTTYIGKYVFVKVTANKANYNTATFTDVTDASTNGSDTVKDSSIVITTNPSNLAVKEGVAGSFSVVATGTNLKYQWYKATSTTGVGTAITGATGATYSITAANMVRGLNGSYYYCTVSNSAGSATSTRALLTVYYAPSIKTQPTDQNVNIGTKATFTIVANAGNPSTTTYKWQYRTSASATWADCTTIQGTGMTTSSFTTVATTMAMNGYQYRCIIGNAQYASAATSNAATLTVKKLDITPTVNMTGYTYGGTKSEPSVEGNTGNGTVTYYYNTTNSNANGTLWSTVTSSTTLNAGTYYMYAVVSATTNYNGATTSAVPFIIEQRDVTIKPKDASKVYDTLPLTSNVAEVTAGSLVSGHTATITTTGSITSVGSITNTISTLIIKDASGTDVTANYNVTKVTGTLTITSASVDFDITLDNDTFEYDGTEKEPEATIKVDGKTLVEGTDYDVSYKDNKDAGTATITITGKGNYEGSIGEKTFEITKRAITVKANDASKAYDTLPLTNNTYTITSGTLAQDHTMTVTISGTITDVGSVPNTITNVVIKDTTDRDVTVNYNITKQAGTLTITPAKDAKFDITLDKDTFVYDGTAKKPTPTVKVGTATLVKGTDYDVSYKDNVNAGTATVTIIGKGNYAGAIGEKTFTITKANITPTVNMSDYVYGGTKADPSVNGNTGNGNVTYYYNTSNSNSNGTNWTTVTSSTSLSAGTYYMYAVIEETANYKGATTPTKEFRITSIDISENNPNVTATIPSEERIYKDAEYRPEVTLKNGTETLVLNKDYTVTYTNNINAGMATITITGINNYSGSRTINFMISKRPITIKPKDATKEYDTLPLTSNEPEVTAGSLVFSHEITLTTTGTITNVGTVENTISTLIIKDASGTDVTSNYDITKGVGTLTVTAADNVDFDITLDNDSFVYDGIPKEPGLTIKVNGVTLEEGKDYDVSYKNNKDAGTATVTITGKGNYEGSSSTKDFTITKRPLEITAGSASKVYNGTALTSSAFSITSGTSLAPDQTLSVTTSGTITNVGTTSNVIATYNIYHNGENVTANYSVTLKEGILEVKPATITGSVIITGTNRVGKTLTAEVTVNPNDASLTYAWYYGTTNDINNATVITGANAKTYSPTTDKIGMYIFVKVTASKENYNDATFTDITDNENNKVEKVGDRLTPYLMAREVQTVTSNGVTSEKAGYAIGAYRAGKTKYTSDLIKSVTIINLLETNAPTTYEAMWDASRDENEAVYAWAVKNQTNSSMYDLYIGGEGTLVLTNGKRLFADYTKCDNINGLNKMNSTNVTDMSYMFSNLASMSTLDVSVVNTSSVTNMEGMFMTNNLTTLNVSGFDTSKVTNMSKMFKESSNLTSLNINGFNTTNTNNMSQMFMDCGNITSLNVNAFNTSNVTNMSAMFMGMSKLETLNVTNFNTANVTDMSSMFASCLKVQRLDLHTFNTTKVTNISGMFTANSSMKSVLLGEEFNKLNGSNMFTGCSSLKAIIAQKKITASSEAMTLSATGTGLNTLTNATLYVPNLESKGYYETATNYATVFGEARVKPILEIIGSNPVHVTVGTEYVDQGAKVAGFEEAEASEYTVYGYTLSVSGLPVDTSTVGTKLVIYTVKYKDQVVVTGATW